MRRIFIVSAFLIAVPLVGLLLGAIPVPARSPPAGQDTGTHTIYVISNGFHSAIALPADVRVAVPAAAGERRELLEAFDLGADDFPVDSNLVHYWQFGWGSKTAYTSLRAVRDLTPAIAVRALALDVSVMHVQPLAALEAGPGIYQVDLSAAQLDALVATIASSFAQTTPIAEITQGFGDRFYPGRGRFSPIRSCNTWTGQRLRAAGLGMGTWTPIAATLEPNLARVQAR